MPEWFNITKDIFELVSYVVTSIGIFSLVIVAFQYWNDKKVETKQRKIYQIENSLKVLKAFAENIIPKAENIHNEKIGKIYNTQLNDVMKRYKLQQKSDVPQKVKQDILVDSYLRAGAGDILNNLEYICIYINKDLVDVDVVYTPLHSTFLGILKDYEGVLKKLSTKDTPFYNIMVVKEKWEKEEKEQNLNEMQEKLNTERQMLR